MLILDMANVWIWKKAILEKFVIAIVIQKKIHTYDIITNDLFLAFCTINNLLRDCKYYDKRMSPRELFIKF